MPAIAAKIPLSFFRGKNNNDPKNERVNEKYETSIFILAATSVIYELSRSA